MCKCSTFHWQYIDDELCCLGTTNDTDCDAHESNSSGADSDDENKTKATKKPASTNRSVDKKRSVGPKPSQKLELTNSRFLHAQQELERKRADAARLHPQIWHNEPALLNDSLLCKCSYNARKIGSRHQVFVGEQVRPSSSRRPRRTYLLQDIRRCHPLSNNADKLHHYVMTVRPLTNMHVR
jgi:hypothetical protein